ncbi:MAG TPA: hypothetical protein DCY94_03120 [Firmicutes bacterium]|nr:hypothetical protein [Bacillota bacterium]
MSSKTRNYLLLGIFLCFVFVSSFGICYSFIKIKMGGPIIIERGQPNNDKNSEVEKDDTEDNKKIEVTDGVTLKNVEVLKNKIVQSFSLTVNGESKLFSINYEKLFSENGEIIRGRGIDGTLLVELQMREGENFDASYVSQIFGSQSIGFIAGADNENYVIVNSISNKNNVQRSEYYIFDSDLKCINKNEPILIFDGSQKIVLEGDKSLWGKDDPNDYDVQLRAKKEDRKIIAFVHVHEGDCLGTVERREYTIEHGSLKFVTEEVSRVDRVDGTCR